MERPPPQPLRAQLAAADHPSYDEVVARFRTWFGAGAAPPEEHFAVGAYFGALLNSPPMCGLASQMGLFFRAAGDRPGSYSHADREFVDQVLSADWKTNVVQTVHIPDAVKAGVRVEAIEALRFSQEHLLNEDERLLTRYIRQVVAGTVDNPSYQAMTERLGTRGLIEYTGFILWLQWIMRMMQALGTPAPSDEEVDEIIRGLRTPA